MAEVGIPSAKSSQRVRVILSEEIQQHDEFSRVGKKKERSVSKESRQ